MSDLTCEHLWSFSYRWFPADKDIAPFEPRSIVRFEIQADIPLLTPYVYNGHHYTTHQIYKFPVFADKEDEGRWIPDMEHGFSWTYNPSNPSAYVDPELLIIKNAYNVSFSNVKGIISCQSLGTDSQSVDLQRCSAAWVKPLISCETNLHSEYLPMTDVITVGSYQAVKGVKEFSLENCSFSVYGREGVDDQVYIGVRLCNDSEIPGLDPQISEIMPAGYYTIRLYISGDLQISPTSLEEL